MKDLIPGFMAIMVQIIMVLIFAEKRPLSGFHVLMFVLGGVVITLGSSLIMHALKGTP